MDIVASPSAFGAKEAVVRLDDEIRGMTGFARVDQGAGAKNRRPLLVGRRTVLPSRVLAHVNVDVSRAPRGEPAVTRAVFGSRARSWSPEHGSRGRRPPAHPAYSRS
jgi:hypothetical protein